jgi:cytochrome b561
MSIKNTSTSYGALAKFFHWTIALLIIAMLTFGYFLEDIPKDYAGFAYNLHKMTGVTILLLMVLRLGWASINVKPILPFTSVFEKLLEHAVHYALYIFAIVMPLVGWVGSSAAGRAPHIGNCVIALPIPPNKALVETCFYLHNMIAIILITLISLHVLAGLYHYFIRRDDVLRRMMPQH